MELFEHLSLEQIKEMINEGREENLLLDFKTVSSPDFKDRPDRKNFAKALSGFANSSGGVIIWGVDARKNEQGIDCACGATEIEPLSLMLSKLNEFTGQFVNPIVDGVLHKKIETTSDRGFIATLVPESVSGPHMAKGGEDRYYKRSGDSFSKMEHFDLEDMFGRRQKPKLELYVDIVGKQTRKIEGESRYDGSLIIGLRNDGRGTAIYPYLALKFGPSPPYQVSMHGLRNGKHGLPLYPPRKSNDLQFGGDANTVIHPRTKLDVTKIDYEAGALMDRVQDVSIEVQISAQGMILKEDQIVLSGKLMYQGLIKALNDKQSVELQLG